MKSSVTNIGYSIFLALMLILQAGCGKEQVTQSELRGVWLHPGLFSLDEDKANKQIDSLFDAYREIGINNLFCYNTTPDENSFKWDYLDALIKHCHEKGIKIHPIFYPGHNLNLENELSKNPGWLIRDMDGKYLPNYNLANPEVRKFWIDKISSVLKYDVDGIHLDYIRFPISQMYSYDSITCSEFKKKFNYTPLEVSHNCGSMIWCEWIKWNAKKVTELVTEIKAAIDASGKPVVLGADVFPDLETSKVLIGQEWGYWAETGLVDFICPMLYTNNLDLFREYLQNALDAAGKKCNVYPGIGVHTSHNDITKDLISREVIIARKLGAKGMVFFSGYSLNKEMRDTLKAGVFNSAQSTGH